MEGQRPTKNAVADALKGNFLNLEFLSQHLVFMLYVLTWVIAGIYLSHSAETKTHELSQKKTQLHELQSDFVEYRTRLMTLSNESSVQLRAAELGLIVPTSPPQKISVPRHEP